MELINNEYSIQNINLKSIADQFGSPVYIYDCDRMTAQYNRLTAAFSQLDLVTREEFDVQTKVLARTREKLENLQRQVNALLVVKNPES